MQFFRHLALTVVASAGLLAESTVQTPQTTGPYPVGRTLLHWVDSGRADPLAQVEGARRELMVVVWYPAEAGRQVEAAPWMPAAFLEGEANELVRYRRRSPDPYTIEQAREAIRGIRSRAAENVRAARARAGHPVILFEPGAAINPVFYSSLCEDLASHGYVVVGVAPTGWVAAVAFPGGRVVPRSRKLSGDGDWITGTALPLWTADLRFAIDEIGKLNRDRKSIFYGRLDMGRCGAFGHSFGGAAAILAGLQDNRVRAVADLDGSLWGILDDTSFPKPLLAMLHDSSPQYERRFTDEKMLARQLRGIGELSSFYRRGTPGFRVTIEAARHMTFSDALVLAPWESGGRRTGGVAGDGQKTVEVIRGYVREFFGKFLRGERSALLDRAPGQYGIAELRSTTSP